MAINSVAQACDVFKAAVQKKDKVTAQSKLNELKESILQFDSFSVGSNSPEAILERKIARDFFEYAVIFSIQNEDSEAFQRYLVSLRPLYTMTTTTATSTTSKQMNEFPDSELMCTILGLNLLHLLVENKLAEFHSELELLTESQQHHPAVTFCTQLDQHLMVGSYDQVLSAASKPPVEYYSFFLQSLMKTVRVNIADCAAAAYTQLSLQAATQILMFTSHKETLEFITEKYPDWTITTTTNNNTNSQPSSSSSSAITAPTTTTPATANASTTTTMILLKNVTTVSKSDNIPSLKLMTQQLTYASELERIV